MSLPSSQPSAVWTAQNIQSLDCGFKYGALSHEKSFRLLKLLPSSDQSSAIICTMNEHPMEDSKGVYVALSYTWGSLEDKREIILNNHPVLVTSNLYLALQHLRHMEGLLGNILASTYFWIDALCINQQDQTEKAVQIGSMYQIFANAQYVVAWLGPEQDDSKMIMDAIDHDLSTLDVQSLSASALLAFLNRPWWTRAWVLQECMAASLMWVVCGSSYTMSIHVYGFINKILMYIDRSSYYIQRTLLRDTLSYRWHTLLSIERFQSEGCFPLYDIVKISSNLEATDPRDRVFALLGLVDTHTSLQLKPDYNISPCEIFCKVIRLMTLDEKRSAAILKKFPISGIHKGHEPLKENVSERLQCDGIACSSRSLCFNLPILVSGEVSDVVGAFVMGLQDPTMK